MINVLSIDFDFFQNIIPKYMDDYPDGIDYSTSESEKQWKMDTIFLNPINYFLNP